MQTPIFDHQLPVMLAAVEAEIERLKLKRSRLLAEECESSLPHAGYRCRAGTSVTRAGSGHNNEMIARLPAFRRVRD